MTDLPPPLPRDELNALIKQYRNGNDDAGRTIILHNLRFARQMAANYAKMCTHLTCWDLFQEAAIGLSKALDRFDPDKGNNFLTYASFWIRRCIFDAIRNEHLIRVPTNLATRMHRECVGKPVKQTRHLALARNARQMASMDDNYEDGEPLHEHIPSTVQEPNMDAAVLKTAVARLDAKERFVIERRFGLYDDSKWTLDDVAIAMPIYGWPQLTRERIRQIESKALKKLRHLIAGSREQPILLKVA